MQAKSIAALSVICLAAGGAHAQSQVSVYGKIDLGGVLDRGNPSGKSVRIDSGVLGASRLGFKGIEDLGNGYSASFQIETGFCSNGVTGINGAATGGYCTGNNSFMGRLGQGALTGPFGKVSAGLQYTLGFLNLLTFDPFNVGMAGRANNLMDGNGTRFNNSLQYVSPKLAGFSASGQFALGEHTGDFAGGRGYSAAITYADGPGYLGATYYEINNPAGGGTAKSDALIGGSYDFGWVKAHAGYQHTGGSPTGHPSIGLNDFLIGATIPLAAGRIIGSYVDHSDRTSANRSASQLALGYVYPLSKRTSVYSAFAKINPRGNSSTTTYTVGNNTSAGTGNQAFNFGLVHDF